MSSIVSYSAVCPVLTSGCMGFLSRTWKENILHWQLGVPTFEEVASWYISALGILLLQLAMLIIEQYFYRLGYGHKIAPSLKVLHIFSYSIKIDKIISLIVNIVMLMVRTRKEN